MTEKRTTAADLLQLQAADYKFGNVLIWISRTTSRHAIQIKICDEGECCKQDLWYIIEPENLNANSETYGKICRRILGLAENAIPDPNLFGAIFKACCRFKSLPAPSKSDIM